MACLSRRDERARGLGAERDRHRRVALHELGRIGLEAGRVDFVVREALQR